MMNDESPLLKTFLLNGIFWILLDDSRTETSSSLFVGSIHQEQKPRLHSSLDPLLALFKNVVPVEQVQQMKQTNNGEVANCTDCSLIHSKSSSKSQDEKKKKIVYLRIFSIAHHLLHYKSLGERLRRGIN